MGDGFLSSDSSTLILLSPAVGDDLLVHNDEDVKGL